ncbi:MAG: hypothetical protein CV087_21360, partial [Candidatus Brocadia sp. WS118]
RLILALFIASVVAKPIELKIFDKDITRQLAENRKTKITQIEQDLRTFYDEQKVPYDSTTAEWRRQVEEKKNSLPDGYQELALKLEEENKKLTEVEERNRPRIEQKDRQRSQLWTEINNLAAEVNSLQNTLQNPPVDSLTVQKQVEQLNNEIKLKKDQRYLLNRERAELLKEITDQKKRIGYAESQIDSVNNLHALAVRALEQKKQKVEEENEAKKDTLEATKIREIQKTQAPFQEYEGFLVRLEALSDLEKENTPIKLASWFIFLLFTLLETAPVIVKMLTPRGPYEKLLQMKEYENHIKTQRKISRINVEVRQDLNTHANITNLRFHEREAFESMALQMASQSYRKILKEMIAWWENQIRQDFRENPDRYIRWNPEFTINDDGRPTGGWSARGAGENQTVGDEEFNPPDARPGPETDNERVEDTIRDNEGSDEATNRRHDKDSGPIENQNNSEAPGEIEEEHDNKTVGEKIESWRRKVKKWFGGNRENPPDEIVD